MKIAVIQFNSIVGDLSGNVERMASFYREADAQGVDLVVFPEMAITGYPIEDLAESRHFCSDAAGAAFDFTVAVDAMGGKAGVLFGCLLENENGKPFNGAKLYDPIDGVTQWIAKYELPNYGVFDEKRIFSAALDTGHVLDFRGTTIGAMICEDCWFDTVTRDLIANGAEILISINGSPFEIGKNVTRIKVVQERRELARSLLVNDIPFLYVNMVGGQDELVFDGGSFLIDGNGLTQLPFFEEGIHIVEPIPGERAFDMPDRSSTAAIYQACVLGLRDYVRKIGFESVVLGMSGGVDSGIVAAIACDALGPDKVNLVRLPSRFSSKGSLDDAEAANYRLGTSMRTVFIEGVADALRMAYSDAMYDSGYIKVDKTLTGVADENIQARARGNILMAISNQENHMLLTTGNKSEVSVGYSTLYGDMAGGFNPIKDCYKTTVWAMCRYRNALSEADLANLGFLGRATEVVPEAIIVKPPSAELRPDQKDEDSLPPYLVLDDILERLVEKNQSAGDIAKIYPLDMVMKVLGLLNRAEYKRRQAAPGIKITSKLHGRERRVPIVNHYMPRVGYG